MATKQKTAGNKPVATFKARGNKVSVWENVSEKDGKKFHKVTVQKVYREGEEWKTTNSFGREDIPIICALLNDAWRWVLQEEMKQGKEEQEREDRE